MTYYQADDRSPLRSAKTRSALIVDDSPIQCKLLSKRLINWGYDVAVANTGDVAIALCQQCEFDFVLSDWIMPGMDGLEFCRQFRKLPRSGYGYFILLTSKTDKADIAIGLDCGADDFVSKPVSADELHARMNAGERILTMEERLQVEIKKTNQAFDQLRVVNKEIKKDLKQAENLQRSLIPDRTIKGPNFVISNIFQSSAHVGGDLLGTFALGSDRCAIYSIDVSGHGVSSALLTMRLHSFLSPHSRRDNIVFDTRPDGQHRLLPPQELAQELNARMLKTSDTDLYFTMSYADINLRTGHVKMVQAGHSHPIILGADQSAKLLGNGGLPIGLMADVTYEETQYTLQPGDKLLLYSDGLSECENPSGQQLDDLGLANMFEKLRHLNGVTLLDTLYNQVTQFAQRDQFDDDVSAILFEYE